MDDNVLRRSCLDRLGSSLKSVDRLESPYKPIAREEHSLQLSSRVPVCLVSTVTFVCAVGTSYLFVYRPDVEQFLMETIPGRHLPDAFDHVNDAVSLFCILLTASLVVSLWLTLKQLHSLFIPLTAGPALCVVGWYLTENFDDPNWSHLFSLATIGMLASCVVTSVLAGMSKSSTEPINETSLK